MVRSPIASVCVHHLIIVDIPTISVEKCILVSKESARNRQLATRIKEVAQPNAAETTSLYPVVTVKYPVAHMRTREIPVAKPPVLPINWRLLGRALAQTKIAFRGFLYSW